MIAGELEGMIGFDSYDVKESSQKSSSRASNGTPKPNERKGSNLIDKGKDIIEKNGGVDGLKDTFNNYKNYIKDDSPSDYDINFGKTMDEKKKDEKKEEKIFGMPPVVAFCVIGGTVVLFSFILYSATRP